METEPKAKQISLLEKQISRETIGLHAGTFGFTAASEQQEPENSSTPSCDPFNKLTNVTQLLHQRSREGWGRKKISDEGPRSRGGGVNREEEAAMADQGEKRLRKGATAAADYITASFQTYRNKQQQTNTLSHPEVH